MSTAAVPGGSDAPGGPRRTRREGRWPPVQPALEPVRPQLWSVANSTGRRASPGSWVDAPPRTPTAAEPPSQRTSRDPRTHQRFRGRVCLKPPQGFFPVL